MGCVSLTVFAWPNIAAVSWLHCRWTAQLRCRTVRWQRVAAAAADIPGVGSRVPVSLIHHSGVVARPGVPTDDVLILVLASEGQSTWIDPGGGADQNQIPACSRGTRTVSACALQATPRPLPICVTGVFPVDTSFIPGVVT
jgi:hypothetical protein